MLALTLGEKSDKCWVYGFGVGCCVRTIIINKLSNSIWVPKGMDQWENSGEAISLSLHSWDMVGYITELIAASWLIVVNKR